MGFFVSQIFLPALAFAYSSSAEPYSIVDVDEDEYVDGRGPTLGQFEASSKNNLECVSTKFTENRPFIDHLKAICSVMRPQKEVSYTNSESLQKMLSDDMLRFVFVYDARFADALSPMLNYQAK